MQKIKNFISFCLVFFCVLYFSACSCKNKDDGNYFYFENSVVELYVGESLNILSLEHQTNVDENNLSLITSENIEADGLVFRAIDKGFGYVYVCCGETKLSKIDVRVYQNLQNESAISYIVVSQIDGFYVVDITKDDEPYTNFVYECENVGVEINIVNGNSLYIYAQGVSSFSITIKDRVDLSSLVITLPSE